MSLNLQEVEKLFGKSSRLDRFETIQISKTKLLKSGEVPPKWLEEFKDFETWNQLKFNSNGETFDGMFALLTNNQKTVSEIFRSVSCQWCPKTLTGRSYISTFINHVVRQHSLKSLKFCCLICSKVFYNIPFLSKHYQNDHSDDRLSIFPCFECGLYCQSIVHLKKHKKQHIDWWSCVQLSLTETQFDIYLCH